jgi:uncharacterized alpha-E superfamily protein
MLSRVATGLYLVGRRLERADHLARLVSVHQELALEGSTGGAAFWGELAACAGLPVPSGAAPEVRRQAVGAAIGEIRASMQIAAEAARAVRPSISSEVFEQINSLNERARSEEQPTAHYALRAIQLGVHLVTGLTDDAMAHGQERDFLRIGRNLERAGNVTRLVAHKAAAPSRAAPDANVWAGVLRCAWSLEAYRARGHPMPPDAAGTVAALLFDPGIPRSARRASERVARISRGLGPGTKTVPRAADRLARLYRFEGEFEPAGLVELDRLAASAVIALEVVLRSTFFMPSRILQRLDVSDQQQ